MREINFVAPDGGFQSLILDYQNFWKLTKKEHILKMTVDEETRGILKMAPSFYSFRYRSATRWNRNRYFFLQIDYLYNFFEKLTLLRKIENAQISRVCIFLLSSGPLIVDYLENDTVSVKSARDKFCYLSRGLSKSDTWL